MVLTPSHFQSPQNSHHRVLKSSLQKRDIQTGSNLDSTFKSMVTGRLISTLGGAVASANTFGAGHLVRLCIKWKDNMEMKGWSELLLEGGRKTPAGVSSQPDNGNSGFLP